MTAVKNKFVPGQVYKSRTWGWTLRITSVKLSEECDFPQRTISKYTVTYEIVGDTRKYDEYLDLRAFGHDGTFAEGLTLLKYWDSPLHKALNGDNNEKIDE